MSEQQEYSRKVIIENQLGFHVRPVQRFSELARVFEGDIEVEIGGKRADGKSVMGLMSLGAQSGSEMEIITSGPDAKQAVDLLSFVVEENFFVEDQEVSPDAPSRHIDRLVTFCDCFESDIWVEIDDEQVDARDPQGLEEVGLQPTSSIKFHVDGEDSEQASQILEKLADYCFYIEEAMGAQEKKEA